MTGSEATMAENVAIDADQVAIEVAIEKLTATPNTIQKAKAVTSSINYS